MRLQIKQPMKRFKPNPCHWTKIKTHKWKQKLTYETEKEAIAVLDSHPGLKLQGMKAYFCPICNKWHLGHS